MEAPHGGPRPGAGRKPGVGKFAGGRPISTRRLKTGQTLTMWQEDGDGNRTPLDTVEVHVISRTRIEFHVVASNSGNEGMTIVLIS